MGQRKMEEDVTGLFDKKSLTCKHANWQQQEKRRECVNILNSAREFSYLRR
jgi:hypothetical protein